MSDDLNARFEQAAADVKSLSKSPGNDTLLKLYALYKQGTAGDVTGKRPGMLDLAGRAKFDAWSGLKGTSQAQAKQDYIALVKSLLG